VAALLGEYWKHGDAAVTEAAKVVHCAEGVAREAVQTASVATVTRIGEGRYRLCIRDEYNRRGG